VSLGLVAAVTGVVALLHGSAPTSGLVVLYLLAVLPVAVMWGVGLAVGVSVVSTVTFDFFFLPPLYVLGPSQSEDWIALATFLLTAVVVSQLAARLRQQAGESARLADEQAALRRVATLVAGGVAPGDVFAAVCKEVALVIPWIETTTMLRYEPDATATVMARWAVGEWRELIEAVSNKSGIDVQPGARMPLAGNNVPALVLRSERPARIDDYASVTGPLAEMRRELGIWSTVGAPIVVDGRLWGVMLAAARARRERLPVATESRMAEFTALVGTAISNAQARAELTASRVRIVGAADETRRRIERDLHDGTQQRLVSLALDLRNAQATVPPEATELKARLGKTAEGLAGAVEDLQEISRGIHPAILSDGGLGPALKGLARRSSLPVKLDVGPMERLPQAVETAAYYVVAEALANAIKHASASVAHVGLEVRDRILRVSIRDDGVGGADPAQGSGLVGLRDRVEAVGGTIAVTSPPGQGTSMVLELPVEPDQRV
jgi:signal transduction histidine kinase